MRCRDCLEVELVAPLSRRRAARFGLAHGAAIIEQAALGLPRTLPLWLIPGAALVQAISRLQTPIRECPRQRKITYVVGAAVMMAGVWTVGYAGVSGTRTAVRLARLSSSNVIPVEISCARGGRHVYASAHHHQLGRVWYVDGVFAWPRNRGGGGAVVRRLLARADCAQVALTLTALSPGVAAMYRRVGFRDIAWIYLMRREPQVMSGPASR